MKNVFEYKPWHSCSLFEPLLQVEELPEHFWQFRAPSASWKKPILHVVQGSKPFSEWLPGGQNPKKRPNQKCLVTGYLSKFLKHPGKESFCIIDLIQHQKFQEKRNPFHGRYTHKTAKFWFGKVMNLWRKASSCCSFVQSLKIPSKKGSFARETDFIFVAFFTVVCGL